MRSLMMVIAPKHVGAVLIILTNVALARSNDALPDDGDCTETCWSCFNVNFNENLIFLEQFNCASVDE
jgi:hypothetical protein